MKNVSLFNLLKDEQIHVETINRHNAKIAIWQNEIIRCQNKSIARQEIKAYFKNILNLNI